MAIDVKSGGKKSDPRRDRSNAFTVAEQERIFNDVPDSSKNTSELLNPSRFSPDEIESERKAMAEGEEVSESEEENGGEDNTAGR